MFLLKSKLRIVDNSGAKWGKCIYVLNNKVGQVGDVMLVHLTKIRVHQKKVKRGEMHLAVVVKTKRPIVNKFGMIVRFDESAIVLLKRDHTLFGSRIKGFVSSELRLRGFLKIVLLADGFV
jgi:large subunit ribosomal protein L14